jgi:hypothetical protein
VSVNILKEFLASMANSELRWTAKVQPVLIDSASDYSGEAASVSAVAQDVLDLCLRRHHLRGTMTRIKTQMTTMAKAMIA